MNKRTTAPEGEVTIREIAKIIYDCIFLPGVEDDGYVMPDFETAERELLGGYERAITAAAALERRIRELGR